MERRNFLQSWFVLTAGVLTGVNSAQAAASEGARAKASGRILAPALPEPVKDRSIPVAFLISDGAEVVDFGGPWGVFEYVFLSDWNVRPFRLFTVAESADPVTVSGGMKVVPNHTFGDAPHPSVVVVPAQSDPTPAMIDWLRKASANAHLTMAVCTGAFLLGAAGMLDGHEVTTHHGAFDDLARANPKAKVMRGARFTDSGNISTSGGLTSGIDLALHVVERYFGREAAERAAYHLEYQGNGWKDAGSNKVYAS